MNVLWWIRGRSRSFKPFAANRIGEIHDSSSPSQWRYVSTRENPTDLPTRGAAVAELKQSEMWWRVPTFLSRDRETWPKTKTDLSPKAAMEVPGENEDVSRANARINPVRSHARHLPVCSPADFQVGEN